MEDIYNTIFLNANSYDNIGLMNGKIGISILFYHLSKKNSNPIHEDFAEELLDDIYEDISHLTPVNFEDGLAGIGWGIEYLAQQGFILADTDEVLEEIDNRIFKELIYNPPKNINLLNGLLGFAAYYLIRIQNKQANNEKILTLTNKQTLIHIIDDLDSRLQPNNILKLLNNDTLCGCSINSFDITWTYAMLILILSKLYEQNIFNFKVEKILHRLIQPLLIDGNLQISGCHKLLLLFALVNLKQSVGHKIKLGNVLSRLSSEISREKLKTELIPFRKDIKNGSCGIALIYYELYQLEKYKPYKEEAEYWIFQHENYHPNDRGISKHKLAESKSLGILEGISGYLLLDNLPIHQT